MEFVKLMTEHLAREIESIAINSAAGYSLMKSWIMADVEALEAKGYTHDVAMAKALNNYR